MKNAFHLQKLGDFLILWPFFGILVNKRMLLPLESEPRLVTAPSFRFSANESYRFCADLARSHYENFPVASLLLPSMKRRHIYAIYAFARVADDFADEPGRSPAERRALLADWEEQLHRAYQGDAEHPVFIALGESVKELKLPQKLFLDLLTASKQDVEVNKYATFDDVLGYCRNSANPVGRLVLSVFGYAHAALFELSDSICTALQLTNFWQDMSIDRERNRLYLPLDEMEACGYSVEDWQAGVENESFRQLMQLQVEKTRKMFERGKALPDFVKGRLSWELRLVIRGGMEILRRIERQNYNTHSGRPALGSGAKARLLLETLFAGHAADVVPGNA